MHILTLLAILLTYAMHTCCAASSSHEESNENDLVQKVVKFATADDGFAIASYHDRVPTDPDWYPHGPAMGNQFGAAIICANPMITAVVHESRELFNKKGGSALYFSVDDTDLCFDLRTHFLSTQLKQYVHNERIGRRYLLLYPYTQRTEEVGKIVNDSTFNSSTIEEMFSVAKQLLPATTFILFDAGTYCDYRAIKPISPLRQEIRAWTEVFKAMGEELQKTPQNEDEQHKSHTCIESLDLATQL
jgi:hypothetical protein